VGAVEGVVVARALEGHEGRVGQEPRNLLALGVRDDLVARAVDA
jgi:hypothetical protein